MSSRLFQEIREKRGLVYGISSFSSAYTDTGMFGIYCGTGENQIQELIPVLCNELNRERGVIIQEIGMYLDTPDDMIFDYWQEKAFPNQPMGRSILGKTDIIKNITREEVKGFMTNHYNPNKMIISAAGKINHDAFVEMIKKSCTNLPVGNSNNREKANYLSGEYREEKKLEQVHLSLIHI